MKLHGQMYRQNGQWVIEIESKVWIIDDILYDVARVHETVKIIIAENPYNFGGTTSRIDTYTVQTNKPKVVTSEVTFKETE